MTTTDSILPYAPAGTRLVALTLGAIVGLGACGNPAKPPPLTADQLDAIGRCEHMVSILNSAATRPDAAEARLRRALVPLLERGCQQGQAQLCAPLAMVLRDRLPGGFDEMRAHALFLRASHHLPRACEAGDAHACETLSIIFGYGLTRSQDHAKAKPYLRRAHRLYQTACARDDAHACFDLLRLRTVYPSVRPDRAPVRALRARSLALLQGACATGDGLACASLFRDAQGERNAGEEERRRRQALPLVIEACVKAGVPTVDR